MPIKLKNPFGSRSSEYIEPAADMDFIHLTGNLYFKFILNK